MKIKSNMIFNTSIMAQHVRPKVGDGDVVIIGSSQPLILLIPAGATISLSDEKWKQFNTPASRSQIASGDLTLVESPVLSVKAQAEADVVEEAELRASMVALKARRAEAEARAEEAAAKAAEQDALGNNDEV